MIPETHNLRDFLASLEKAVIQRALKITDGAQAEVARRLGMSKSDLSYKLGKHRIKDQVDRLELRGSPGSRGPMTFPS